MFVIGKNLFDNKNHILPWNIWSSSRRNFQKHKIFSFYPKEISWSFTHLTEYIHRNNHHTTLSKKLTKSRPFLGLTDRHHSSFEFPLRTQLGYIVAERIPTTPTTPNVSRNTAKMTHFSQQCLNLTPCIPKIPQSLNPNNSPSCHRLTHLRTSV